MSLQQIIDRATEIALKTSASEVQFDEHHAELLLPHVYTKVLNDWRFFPEKLDRLRDRHDLDFIDGECSLPSNVMPEYLASSVLFDEANPSMRACFKRSFFDFRRTSDRFGSYTFSDGQILYLEPEKDFDSFDGTLQLLAVTKPFYPATSDAALSWSKDFTDEVVIELARALRGEPPYGQLGEETK